MALPRQLHSFYGSHRPARRSRALVLDVGSGEKPHWRADALVDRYAGRRARRTTLRPGRRPTFNELVKPELRLDHGDAPLDAGVVALPSPR